MNIDKLLISKIIETKDIRTVIKNKVKSSFFVGEAVPVYDFILTHYGAHGEVPTPDALERYFPDYELERCDEPVTFLLDELRKRKMHNSVVAGVENIAQLISDGKVETAVEYLLKVGIDISIDTKVTRDLNVTDDAEDRIQRYEELKKTGGMLGYPYAYDALNAVTGGILSEELISIIGFQGTGKTWLLLWLLHHVWKQGKKVVLFTREMSPEQMARRLDAMTFSLPFQDLKRGMMSFEVEHRYFDELLHMKDRPDFIISADEDKGSGVQSLRAKLEEYQPDIWAVDGAYLLADDRKGQTGWERMMHTTQDIKRVCRMLQTPCILTSQADAASQKETKGIQLVNAAFSKMSIGADSDIVLGMDNLPETNQWLLKLLKCREGENIQFLVNKDFNNTSFLQAGDADMVFDGYSEEIMSPI